MGNETPAPVLADLEYQKFQERLKAFLGIDDLSSVVLTPSEIAEWEEYFAMKQLEVPNASSN